MGRTPCCEKMGLKRGPWTTEEDTILVNYINENGHDNWRALPKRAGLLRCGKSCRLRWMNYLRPDIKRGNFSREEEETIIKLHEELGNKWSVIAAKLPGRTDNEIKNVWNTHLKKKLDKKSRPAMIQARLQEPEPLNFIRNMDKTLAPNSPPGSSSEISSVTTTAVDQWPEMDESFWSEVFSGNVSSDPSKFPTESSHYPLQLPTETTFGSDLGIVESVDAWNDLCYEVEALMELPEIW